MTERLMWLLCGLLAAFAAVALGGAWATASDCRAAGGTPVRGLFGVECIQHCAKEATR
jgi:hypothetical protein